MSSLRSRRTVPSERLPETTSYRRRRRRGDSEKPAPNDTLAKIALGIAFVLVCLGLGYLEYRRVQREPKLSNSNIRHQLLSSDEDAALELHTDNTRYHVIFSTDCSPYQHWQSYLVYYSAYKVRQPGHVTRIASGCTEEESDAILEWFDAHVQPLSTRFHLHLTPHFSGVKNEETGEVVGDYKFFNKVRHM